MKISMSPKLLAGIGAGVVIGLIALQVGINIQVQEAVNKVDVDIVSVKIKSFSSPNLRLEVTVTVLNPYGASGTVQPFTVTVFYPSKNPDQADICDVAIPKIQFAAEPNNTITITVDVTMTGSTLDVLAFTGDLLADNRVTVDVKGTLVVSSSALILPVTSTAQLDRTVEFVW